MLYQKEVRFDVTGTTNCQSVLPTGTGEKLLKVVSSKALSGVRPNYTLFSDHNPILVKDSGLVAVAGSGTFEFNFSLPFPPPPPQQILGKDIH